jgi:AcrR family transcriptional regulator
MALIRKRRSAPHARGLQKRRRMLDAARGLLARHAVDEITLSDVARAAGVASSSAYHFYADIDELLVSLQAEVQRELVGVLQRPLRGRFKNWRDVIVAINRRGVRFYNHDAAARQLQIGPRTPPELKLRDRRSDAAIGRLYEQHIDSRFMLPALPRRPAIFYRAVEIADLMFCLSLVDAGLITAEMHAEADRACTAYLGTYLPAVLPRRA